MQLTEINVDGNLKSQVKYGSVDFPLEIYLDEFHKYDIGFIRWHWHNEVEFAVMKKGSAEFLFLDKSLILSEGEGIFINSNTLHQIKPINQDSTMTAIIFNPILISGQNLSSIDKNYVTPITTNSNVKFIKLNQEGLKDVMISELHKICDIYEKKAFAYELWIKSSLCTIWINLISILMNDIESHKTISHEEKRIKTMLEYIHNNFYRSISLNDIAESVYISKSECCRSFKKYLKMTPFEYLMQYRVIKAAEIIQNTGKPLSEIAHLVGFNDTSYFTKTFKRFINLSPRDYRKLTSK